MLIRKKKSDNEKEEVIKTHASIFGNCNERASYDKFLMRKNDKECEEQKRAFNRTPTEMAKVHENNSSKT